MATRKLKVALSPGCEGLEAIKRELIEKGHEVTVLASLGEWDLVLGGNCHRLTAENEKIAAALIKSSRFRKYGPKGSKVKVDYKVEGD